jgi:cation transport regulator ChaC
VASSSDDLLWYFAYGSNLNLATFTGRRRMRPLQMRWGWLEGYRLCFDIPVGPGERGVANICVDVAARICGVLYQLTAEEAARLDRTEGVDKGVYRRVAVTVAIGDGERVEAFAYQSALTQGGRRPSARYIGLLVDGAREHGLPAEYVRYLESFELAVDERLAEDTR